MWKIAIDLSTTNTGIVIFQDNKYIAKYDLLFNTFNEVNLKENMEKIGRIVARIKSLLVESKPKVLVGIEVANFNNAKLTSRFNLYSGAFIQAFLPTLHDYIDVDFKLFNSNAWHKLIGVNIGLDDRSITKAKAREFVKNKEKEYTSDWSEDCCDAYCIAYYLELIKSTEQQHREIKQRQSSYIKKVQGMNRINRLVETRLRKIQALDKQRNQKQIARLIQEIEMIKRDKNNE